VTEYKPVVGDSLDRLNYGQTFMGLAFAQDMPQVMETSSQGELPGGRQRGLLSLRVDANGQLLSVTVSKSCGFEELDLAVLEQVRSKSSYPPPKPELLDELGELALESVQFEVEVLGTSESEWRVVEPGSPSASNDGYLYALSARF
jgi:TonB family protein